MKYYYRPPPAKTDIQTLIRFIVDNGLGRNLADSPVPERWTAVSLSDALEVTNANVSVRSIENWLSGTFVPSQTNIRSIAQFISNDDTQRTEWLDVLLEARASVKKQPTEKTATKIEPQVSIDHQEIFDGPNRNPRSKALIMFWIVLIITPIAAWLYFEQTDADDIKPRAINLKTCDEARFSDSEKKCVEDVSNFPANIEEIYLSFDLENTQSGQEFKRTWFRCGREIASKPSRNIHPWEGYTWIKTTDFQKQGPFSVNVVVGDSVAVKRFSIGDFTDETAICRERI